MSIIITILAFSLVAWSYYYVLTRCHKVLLISNNLRGQFSPNPFRSRPIIERSCARKIQPHRPILPIRKAV